MFLGFMNNVFRYALVCWLVFSLTKVAELIYIGIGDIELRAADNLGLKVLK
jgi:hypothetical protein